MTAMSLHRTHGAGTTSAMTALSAMLLRLVRGPCPACARGHEAPFCDGCRTASRIGTQLHSSRLDGERLLFLGAYHDRTGGLSPLGRSLLAFKDRGDRYAGRCLARVFAASMSTVPAVDRATLVVPVPPDRARLRARGVSPAAWFAHTLARRTGASYSADVLRRVEDRRPQRGLGGAARRRNVAGAFAPGRQLPAGCGIVLVDDVVTTGATLAEAARCLRDARAGPIGFAVLACADEQRFRETVLDVRS